MLDIQARSTQWLTSSPCWLSAKESCWLQANDVNWVQARDANWIQSHAAWVSSTTVGSSQPNVKRQVVYRQAV